MKRPSFQFYPADWRNNGKLRRCSHAARGAWVDILGILHDSDEYGVVRWPLADLALAAGVPIKLAKELVAKEVLKGGDKGCPAYIYTPRHANREGDPVTLIEATTGPCWYCSRFVRDEYVRQKRGNSSRFTEAQQPTRPKASPDTPPKSPPIPSPKSSPKPPLGERQGDGPTSPSPSPSSSPPTGEREPARPAPAERPPLSPSHLMPIDRVKLQLATVWPDSTKALSASAMHDLFGSLALFDELSDEDWLASRAWRAAPLRLRNLKAEWPRDKTEFIQKADQAIEQIRRWWHHGGGKRWWNDEHGRPGTTADSASAIPAAFIAWAGENYSLSAKSCWASETIRSEWEASQQDHAA